MAVWFLLVAIAVIASLVGYVMWRDRRRAPGAGRAAEDGEGRAAAESAQISRGANDVGGF